MEEQQTLLHQWPELKRYLNDKYGSFGSDKLLRATIVLQYAQRYRLVQSDQIGRVVRLEFDYYYRAQINSMDEVLLFYTEEYASNFMSQIDAIQKEFFIE